MVGWHNAVSKGNAPAQNTCFRSAFCISRGISIFFSLIYLTYHGSIHHTMGHTFANINVHIIFHTKSTGCVMQEKDLTTIFHYVGGLIRSFSGTAYMIGVRPDHLHILTSLPLAMSLSEFVRTIKANTSRWIKELSPEYKDFLWQAGYGAFSVSESNKEHVIDYIRKQKEHHRGYSAQEEFRIFLNKHGITASD